MIRFLPFILIPIILVAGLWYWRSSTAKQNLDTQTAESVSENSSSVEVPKTLPGATIEQRVGSLEDTITKLATQVNNLNSSSSPAPSNLNSRLSDVESAVTELKARVSALEKATPAPASAGSKAPLYIPLGAGGGPWLYADWTSLNEYQVSIDPNDYGGYSNMQLEVNFRLVGAPGTGYVRLYNTTDQSVVASEINTTNTAFGVLTSATFKLTGGQKLYTIQVKSTDSQDLYIQSARIKVNF